MTTTDYVSPLPPRKREKPTSWIRLPLGLVTGFFDYNWMMGNRPAIMNQKVPLGIKMRAIVPAHLSEASIEETVRSIINQTYFIEKIYVAENSRPEKTDDTYKIVCRLAEEFPGRIVPLKLGFMGGKARAINTALEHPDVEWSEITFFADSEVVFDPDYVVKCLEAFHHPNYIASSGEVTVQWPKDISFWAYFWTVAKFNEYATSHGLVKSAANHFCAHVVVAGCGYLAFTDYLKKLPENFIAEDMAQTWLWQLDGWRVWCALGVLCRAKEPETRETAGAQRERWLRGFWQNYNEYGWRILKHHPKLALLVNYMMINTIGYFILLIDNLFNSGELTYFILAFLAPSISSFVVTTALSVIYPWRLGKTFSQKIMYSLIGLISILPAIVLGLQAQVKNLKAIWYEIVLKNRLTIWVLGHSTSLSKKQA